jgi:hypothetical protein
VQLPELLRIIELNFAERNVGKAAKSCQEISRGRFFITESYFGEVELRVIDELVMFADFEETLTGLSSVEAIRRMKELENLDENLKI